MRKKEDQIRADFRAMLGASIDEIRRWVAEVVAEVAGGHPEPIRRSLGEYLRRVPGSVSASVRGSLDFGGGIAIEEIPLRDTSDLEPLLPRVPRFREGDRPLGVDRELVRLLGVGGFGEVWVARNPEAPRVQLVALKFCLDPEARDRLLRHEADMHQHVGKHPGFVALQNTYLSNDPPCLEYEYIDGVTLGEWLLDRWQSAGPLPVNVATKVAARLAEVVGHVHRLDDPVVHRDLKPSNVLAYRAARGVDFKITDFGIGGLAGVFAGAGTGSLTRGDYLHRALRGAHSPLYASPQQKKGFPPDPRDDVYALGVIWYQMLVGNLAAEAPTGVQWQEKLSKRGMCDDAIRLLAACMEPEPECRPADAKVLAENLASLGWVENPEEDVAQPSVPAVTQSERNVSGRKTAPSRWIKRFGWIALLGSGFAAVCIVSWLIISSHWTKSDLTSQGSPQDSTNARITVPQKVAPPKLINTLRGHAARVKHVAFSPDGRSLVSIGEDSMLRHWDAATGEEIHNPLKVWWDDADKTRTYSFSPDGLNLAVSLAGLEKTILINRTTGKQSYVPGYRRAFSPNGKLLVSGSWIWDIDRQSEIRLASQEATDVWTGALSPDCQTVGGITSDRTAVVLWDINTGLRRHTLSMNQVAGFTFSPDSKMVATVGKDAVAIWNVITGQECQKLQGNQSEMRYVRFTPDGLHMWGVGQSLRTWDLAAGKSKTLLAIKTPEQPILTLQGGEMIAWQSSEGVRLHTLATGSTRLLPYRDVRLSPKGRITGTTNLLPDGGSLAVAEGRQITFFNASSGEIKAVVGFQEQLGNLGYTKSIDEDDSVSLFAISPDGTKLLLERRYRGTSWLLYDVSLNQFFETTSADHLWLNSDWRLMAAAGHTDTDVTIWSIFPNQSP